MVFRFGLAVFRRRFFRRLLQLSVFLLLAFCVASAIAAYRFNLSLPAAAKGLCRIAALYAIEIGIGLYDPYTPRLANLGPDSEEAAPADGLVRAEDFFQRGANQAAPSRKKIQILEVENEKIQQSPVSFSYQPYDEPRLHELRNKYRLDEVVAGSYSEFEQMVRLRSWARSHFRRRDYQPLMPNFDALEVLDRNVRNPSDAPLDLSKQYDPCHFFPLLYSQVLLSMGHTPRLVSINHGLAEVWSNQYKKWIEMDAELDWHFEKAGVPLNAMEVRQEKFEEKPSSVRIVRGDQSSGDANTTMVHLKVESIPVEAMINYHTKDFKLVELRNDWLTNHYFAGHPRRSLNNTLRFEDTRLEDKAESKELDRLLVPFTKQREDLYWTLNQAEIWVRDSSSLERLDLVLKTVTPNFDCFEIRIDQQEPIRSAHEAFAWDLHEGQNSFTVAPVNKFGIRGIPSKIKVRLAPPDLAEKHSPEG